MKWTLGLKITVIFLKNCSRYKNCKDCLDLTSLLTGFLNDDKDRICLMRIKIASKRRSSPRFIQDTKMFPLATKPKKVFIAQSSGEVLIL